MEPIFVGVEFKVAGGNRIVIRPDQILFVEELTEQKVQITTERWLKIVDAKYDDIINAIITYSDSMRVYNIKPYKDIIVKLASELEKCSKKPL
jgi:hypothetical protein